MKVPGPRGWSLLRALRALSFNPPQALAALHEQYGDVFELRVAGRRILVLNQPEAIQQVLRDVDRFGRAVEEQRLFKTFLGEGLLTSEGEAWRAQRAQVQPTFLPAQLGPFVPVVRRHTDQLLARWRETRTAGEPVDLPAEMVSLTLGITLEVLLGPAAADPALRPRWLRSLTVLHEEHLRLRRPVRVPGWLPTPGRLRFRRALREVDALLYARIDDARREEGHHLLAALSRAALGRSALRDQLLTVLFAGYATAATTLCWVWFALEQNPAVEAGLREELEQVLQGRAPRAEDLPRLERTARVVEETLRLYPPVWVLGRQVTRDGELAGVPVARGTNVVFSPYVLQRHPGLWVEPEAFRPERFVELAPRARTALIPFGGGPRVCPGAAFARLEAQLVLASLAQAYRLRVVPGQQLVPGLGAAMRPRRMLASLEPAPALQEARP